ncbi:MAG TPA: sigma 54-interacting transcriptional regulator [Thermoanaerobaculia bacterium]
MSMRGSTRRAGGVSGVTPQAFQWDRAVTATLRHVSLPWNETVATTPLPDVSRLGTRDRLSLIAQFAAHQAFLSFAGITDGELDPSEWGVEQKRGSDLRLVRLSARSCEATAVPPALTIIQQLAALHPVDLHVLRHPWARPDAVYAEAWLRLCGDVAADLRWARLAATGEVLAPGAEGLRTLADESGCFSCDDERAAEVVSRYAECNPSIRVVMLRGVSPLRRYSALPSEVADPSLEPAAVSERLLASTAAMRHLFVVTEESALDAGSREVVRLLSTAGHGTWLLVRGGEALPPTRRFIVSPRTASARQVVEALSGSLASFVESPAFDSYLRYGEVPERPVILPALAEPLRSYVGALALLGLRTPCVAGGQFLDAFLFRGTLDELAVPEISAVIDDEYCFVSDAARVQASQLIGAESRAAICRAAAPFASGTDAALLWLEAGDREAATATLDRTTWSSAEELVSALQRVPATILSPALVLRYGHALIDCGRYRDACELAGTDDLISARAERRTGDYATALARLERSGGGFEACLLRAEILRLLERDGEATQILRNCTPSDDEERIRLDYERGLHAADGQLPATHYLGLRLATYRALEQGDHDEAAARGAEALALARTKIETIDALLDSLFASFCAGRWQEARTRAFAALQEVEETQGDRAAGGILFLLAYLAADDGQWAHAAQRIARLRHFYGGTNDHIRLAELQLLSAHLDFSRGHFVEASRAAQAVLEGRRQQDQIREAAAIILDEIAWIDGRRDALLSTGGTGNVELDRRHSRIAAARAGERFTADPASTVADRLFAFRQALAEDDEPTARTLAQELDLVIERADRPRDVEMAILQAIATREFPFTDHELGRPWCFAARNRLGQWSTNGPVQPPAESLEALEPPPGWIVCSERERLFIEGSAEWSVAGRAAVGAIFHIRAENQRLHRVLDQEERTAPAGATLDGIVGQSAAIREIETLVQRIARRDVAVCVLGESGTGKELVARAIHRNSSRRQKTFTPVNCAALPENLIESELFGHVRGAFTGADRDRAGLIETSDGGTLFLDEIGELPLPAQAKLLRFLQDGEFRRVGDTATRSADVRIVSATNRKLDAAVDEGRFRDDLYYRIRGVDIVLPPLRERGADVLLLAAHFLAAEHQKHKSGPVAISPDAEAVFTAYAWPGNVRELQNTIRAAHALAGESKEIDLDHLPERLRNVAPARLQAGSYQDAVSRFKRDLIERSLVQAKGNQNRAAAVLRMSRQALAYQIRELGIMVRS